MQALLTCPATSGASNQQGWLERYLRILEYLLGGVEQSRMVRTTPVHLDPAHFDFRFVKDSQCRRFRVWDSRAQTFRARVAAYARVNAHTMHTDTFTHTNKIITGMSSIFLSCARVLTGIFERRYHQFCPTEGRLSASQTHSFALSAIDCRRFYSAYAKMCCVVRNSPSTNPSLS